MQNNKIAILIDGGFYVRMFKKVQGEASHPTHTDVQSTINDILTKIKSLSGPTCNDLLLRTFYYDCRPFEKTIKHIDAGKPDIVFSVSSTFKHKTHYLNTLKMLDQFALRLGELSFSGWKINVKGGTKYQVPDLKQKGVDMKIGLDIAWMAGKRTVDKIVLVTADSDFISPVKLARREGILVYLYPMGTKSIKAELKEHCDFILP